LTSGGTGCIQWTREGKPVAFDARSSPWLLTLTAAFALVTGPPAAFAISLLPGDVLLASSNGNLTRYDPVADSFSLVNEDAAWNSSTGISMDLDGTVLTVSSNGNLTRYDPVADSFSLVNEDAAWNSTTGLSVFVPEPTTATLLLFGLALLSHGRLTRR